jgi:hypothetical protein
VRHAQNDANDPKRTSRDRLLPVIKEQISEAASMSPLVAQSGHSSPFQYADLSFDPARTRRRGDRIAPHRRFSPVVMSAKCQEPASAQLRTTAPAPSWPFVSRGEQPFFEKRDARQAIHNSLNNSRKSRPTRNHGQSIKNGRRRNRGTLLRHAAALCREGARRA